MAEARRREIAHDRILGRRAGTERTAKVLFPETARVLEEAAAMRQGTPPSQAANRLRVLGRRASTWNRYMGALRRWRAYAQDKGTPFLPASPAIFADFLAESGDAKHRANAIDALSKVAGVPSPVNSEEVSSLREGLRRAGRARRGRARPIFPHEIPAVDSPGTPPRRRRGEPYIRGLTDSGQKRARESALRKLAFMSGGALRHDDLSEAQLGDVMVLPGHVTCLLFGSKTDPTLEGQSAAAFTPHQRADAFNGAARAVLAAIRTGIGRLLSLPDAVRLPLAENFRAACSEREIGAGEEELANWPDEIRALAAPLYHDGFPVHCLPLFGAWQYETLTATSNLRKEMGIRKFVQLTKALLAESCVDTTGFGAHSARRGSATALFERRAGLGTVSAALRHRNPRSTQAYVLEQSRMADLAAACRAAMCSDLDAGDAVQPPQPRPPASHGAAPAPPPPAGKGGAGDGTRSAGAAAAGAGPGVPPSWDHLRFRAALPRPAGGRDGAAPLRPPGGRAAAGAAAAHVPGGRHAPVRAGNGVGPQRRAGADQPVAARGGLAGGLLEAARSRGPGRVIPSPFVGS